MHFQTAHAYAAYLATYIASPLKIEKLVERDWTYAPPLHEIAELRYQYEQSKKPKVMGVTRPNEGIEKDHLQWQPRSLLPKPRARTVQRQRDYIILLPTKPAKSTTLGDFPVSVGLARRLINSVARDFEVTPEEMVGERRHKHLVLARSVVAVLLKRRGWSYPRIARAIGRNDHTTVINAVRQFDIYQSQDDRVSESYQRHLMMLGQLEASNDAETACAA